MEDSNENIQFQLKYAPKYYTRAIYQKSDLSDRRLLRKIRSMKLTKEVQLLNYLVKNEQDKIINVFQGQRKIITQTNLKDPKILRHYPCVSNSKLNTNSYQSWRTFFRSLEYEEVNIELSKLYPLNNTPLELKLNTYLQSRLWHHLAKLQKLSHLSVHLSNPLTHDMLNFLKKLSSSSSLLAYPSTLTVCLNYLNFADYGQIDFGNILKYVTHFHIFETSFNILEYTLSHSLELENLRALTIIKTTQLYQGDDHPINLRGLQGLKTLKNLQSLDISLSLSHHESLQSFLKFFSLPKSILSIKLIFYEADWSVLTSTVEDVNWKTNNLFLNLPICTHFYEQWQDLQDLSSLSLSFAESSAEWIPSVYFITPLLKRLSKLDRLYFGNWCNTESCKKALDLGYLWREIGDVKSSLKSLCIESHAITLRSLDADMSPHGTLLELGLCGIIIGDDHLNNLLRIVARRDDQTVLKSKLPSVELTHLLIDSDVSFDTLMKSLHNISKKVSMLLNLDVRRISSNCVVRSLCKAVADMSRKELLILTISNTKQVSQADLKEMTKELDAHKVFRQLVILSRGEKEIYSYNYRNRAKNNQERALDTQMICEDLQGGGSNEGHESSEEDWMEADQSSSFDSIDAFLFSDNDDDNFEEIDEDL